MPLSIRTCMCVQKKNRVVGTALLKKASVGPEDDANRYQVFFFLFLEIITIRRNNAGKIRNHGDTKVSRVEMKKRDAYKENNDSKISQSWNISFTSVRVQTAAGKDKKKEDKAAARS